MLIQFWKRRKKQCVSIVCSISILFSSIFFLNGCEATFLEEKKSSKEVENERFTSFTEKLFCKEVAASQISLHYTLKEPEAYGIDKADTAYGTIQTDSTQIKTAAENIQQALYAFSYEKLNVKNRITYDLLKQYLRNLREEADYLYYEEPLNTVNGVQTQIPIVLSEYQFYDRTDVEEYLDVLSETRDYFQQIIAFEREKADKGLFLSDEMADQVLEQCNAFLAMGNGNYLYSTFVSRIGELQELSEKEKSDYIQQNARQMEEQVCPAYEDLIQAVKELKGKGTNEKGLCYFPEGRKYYEWYIQQSVGVTDTIQELEQLTCRQISEDITGMEEAVNEAKQAAAILEDGKAERILEKLKKGIGTAFPPVHILSAEKFLESQEKSHCFFHLL